MADPYSKPKGIAMPDGDLKSLITNMGAIGVLALLVFRLPEIFRIINEGKKEIATIMQNIQNEAYTNYAQNLQLLLKNSDTRVETLEDTLKEVKNSLTKVSEASTTQTTALQLLLREKKD